MSVDLTCGFIWGFGRSESREDPVDVTEQTIYDDVLDSWLDDCPIDRAGASRPRHWPKARKRHAEVDMARPLDYGQKAVPSTPAASYSDARAHELRARYLAVFGGDEIPVPVESIAQDLLGLRVEQGDLGDCSGVLLPRERLIRLNAREATHDGEPIQRHRFTIAHEIGHWVCHCLEGRAAEQPASMCRKVDLQLDADRKLEREANVFGAELLMPEVAVRSAWAAFPGTADVASRLGVSTLAAQWRLYSFGLGERPA